MFESDLLIFVKKNLRKELQRSNEYCLSYEHPLYNTWYLYISNDLVVIS